MDRLPVEVLTHIFKFLPSINDRKVCSLVCRLWYEAYQDPVFRNVEVLHIKSDDKFRTLTELKNVHRKFLHLVIEGSEISEISVDFWERYGPNIKSLTIIQCDIRKKMFVRVLLNCEQLESLTVKSCRELFMVGHLFEDPNERAFLRNKLKSLHTLNLSYNRYLSDAIFVRFVLVFPNIKKLSLNGCQISFFLGLYKKYYPDGQTSPSESVLTFPVILDYIRHNASHLNFLSFNDTFIDNAAISYLSQVKDLFLTSLNLRGCFQLSQEAIVLLSKSQPTLTELDVSLCPRFTDGCLLAICSGLKELKKLSLQRCMAITDLGLANLYQLEKLQSLDISECDSIEGQGLISGMCSKVNRNFKELRMAYLGNVPDDVVVELSRNLPNLKVLDISCCYNGVTNKSMQSILENNRFLQSLNLTMCEKITDSGFTGKGLQLTPANTSVRKELKFPLGSKAEIEIVREAMLRKEVKELCEKSSGFSGHSLKNLESLQHIFLTGCSGISDLSLMYAFQLRELKTVNLSRCNQVTDEGLEFLVKNNRAIESLTLEYCQNVSDAGVLTVIKYLKRLRSLVLGSNKITDSATEFICEHGKGLILLDIRHCTRISTFAVDQIIKSLPHIREFLYSYTNFDDVDIPLPPDPSGLR